MTTFSLMLNLILAAICTFLVYHAVLELKENNFKLKGHAFGWLDLFLSTVIGLKAYYSLSTYLLIELFK